MFLLIKENAVTIHQFPTPRLLSIWLLFNFCHENDLMNFIHHQNESCCIVTAQHVKHRCAVTEILYLCESVNTQLNVQVSRQNTYSSITLLLLTQSIKK